MQELPRPADVDDVGAIAEAFQQLRELRRTGLVGARGKSDEEMPVRLAHVAGIHRAGCANARDVGEKTLERRLDDIHFAAPRGRAGTRDDRAALRHERRVLDEAAVGMSGIRGQHGEREAAVRERFAIGAVLFERELGIRRAFARLGQAGGKVRTGQSKQCVGQHGGAGVFGACC